jgi:hypothetical protein
MIGVPLGEGTARGYERQCKGQSPCGAHGCPVHRILLRGRSKELRPGLTSASTPGTSSWPGFSAGRPGFSFVWAFTNKGFRVELYIDVNDRDMNKALFDALKERSAQLEALIGSPLSWERLDNMRASRLAIYTALPASPSVDENPALADWAVETMVRWNDGLRTSLAGLEPAEMEP